MKNTNGFKHKSLLLHKHNFVFVMATLLFSSCAVSYHPISGERVASMQSTTKQDVAFSGGIKSLESNPRIAAKAGLNNTRIIEIHVDNKSADTIRLNYGSVSLVGPSETHTGISAFETYYPLHFWVYGYWFYSLIWFGSTSCDSQSGCSSFWLPVGLPITIINVATASSSNTAFLKDLKSNQVDKFEVPPNGNKTGMVYFNVSGKERCDLRIEFLRNQIRDTVFVKMGL